MKIEFKDISVFFLFRSQFLYSFSKQKEVNEVRDKMSKIQTTEIPNNN